MRYLTTFGILVGGGAVLGGVLFLFIKWADFVGSNFGYGPLGTGMVFGPLLISLLAILTFLLTPRD